METPNNWEGRENERLSRYDESNESNPRNYSLSDAENQYRSETRPADPEPHNDNERFDNSYGMGSDSSRSLLMRGNEMVFENDHEGQELDDAWDAAQRDERQETYEEERRRLETERKYGGFDTRV
ncbi:hypothetical protein HUK80_14830 [Flavobacterium sp. MAH-1]|uniref:Uncharacterized protein n=1 Tax=Flavobacterium agri TaxID=2743471 RepID=A0A7Y8Y4C4_9FLAO|nr:hypothetical protein [Flavobacterium agri]NUY82177.1 hypothetical protein [Flavobacterium agri]NYA72201.1 hypothetical protein [Flavobacterium agri]